MTNRLWKGVLLALLACTACAPAERSVNSDQGSGAANAGSSAPEGGSTAAPGNAAAGPATSGPTSSQSILAWSKPAAGSTVNAPVNELVLHFSPPARLGEVTVTGPGGKMPMMVTAVGEVEHYSLPLPGLEPGRYTVEWKASASGVDHAGSFGFEVK